MIPLHPLPEGRFYCGPAAVASFTGLNPKGEIRAAINRLRGRPENRGIIGSNIRELETVLVQNGFRTNLLRLLAPFSLTIAEACSRFPEDAFILTTRNHHIAYSANWCQDNKSGTPRLFHNFPGRRAKVRYMLHVSRPDQALKTRKDLYRQAGFHYTTSGYGPSAKFSLEPIDAP